MKTSGRWDIVRWVLSYGRDAKVLEPEELKEDIVHELQATRANYGDT
jgi:predicted DNA-binding transcriptional regulator YafY